MSTVVWSRKFEFKFHGANTTLGGDKTYATKAQISSWRQNIVNEMTFYVK